MNEIQPLPFTATLPEYESRAEQVFDRLRSGDQEIFWRFKWEHPAFRGNGVEAVRDATLTLEDAKLVVAREYGFEDWDQLARFAEEVHSDSNVARFEAAVEAVISGDIDTLRTMLAEHPELVRARSARRHHATLLHYLAANGVEGYRQKTPPNAVAIATLLLDAGAQVDALADMYDAKCDTMSMLVSSSPPAAAGLQIALAEALLDYGAEYVGPGSNWQSAMKTALQFGFLDTARMFAGRGAPVDDVAVAAGLGLEEEARALLPAAPPAERHAALALAAQHGHTRIVQLLLDAGEDPDRYNPEGYHGHSTPLHQAVWSNHLETVRLLVERCVRLDIRDTVYHATPLGWADYDGRAEIAEYLRERGAQE